ncbi:Hypothetical protein, putative [Bodo saltans]|uniref:Uncharacterized protein n=1 Tax=Bodo saltans TaxID=75058 RepID=A0A0S4KGB1_BODSA|nr:Hypothetical protein, putative [Bodo saltans]|eukprot:CUI13110.1 Hypothetical protein, putative [Bodo saltans]
MRVRQYVLRASAGERRGAGRHFGAMREYLAAMMLNEAVARTLKALIYARATFSNAALQLLGRTVDAGSIADAATHCMQRFLAAPTKFATETLIPQLARRYPCEAGDDAARLEMSDLSVMDIVFFLKHRLGLEFNSGSKSFEVPVGGSFVPQSLATPIVRL